jgi:2-methylisocitrate lyase-like PEP mutase family enzyme
VVATTSGGVAAALGYEDHERAPGDEMLAAAARIATGVDVPVTVDAEAGYGMEPTDLVARLREMGAAGCNLEDTNHTSGELRDPAEQADWLRAVRAAASDQGYGLVINARIDVFLAALLSGAEKARQADLVSEALRRARAYVDAGADCLFPILLSEPDALESFIAEAPGPVNALKFPPARSHAELAKLGVARISYGVLLQRDAIEHFGHLLASLSAEPADEQARQP